MRRFHAAAAFLILTGPALAADPAPMQPRFVTVGERSAVVYYTDTAAGFEVVVTMAANSPDDGTSMRSIVTLTPGQQTTLSLAGPPGQKPASLTIRREADALVVMPAPMRTAAAAR